MDTTMASAKNVGELGRKMPVEHLQPGDRLFDEVRGKTGGQLFRPGEVLTKQDIVTLTNFGVETVWIHYTEDMKSRQLQEEAPTDFQASLDDIEKDLDMLMGAVSGNPPIAEPAPPSPTMPPDKQPVIRSAYEPPPAGNKKKQFVRSAKTKIENVIPGMVLADEVRSTSGAIIVSADTILQPNHIEHLNDIGVTSVFIEICDIPKEFDPLRKKTAIVVDDSLFFRHMFAKMLYRMGMIVSGELKTGEEAITSALTYKPDLLVVDIYLPGIDGTEVIRKLRPRLPNTKFLAVSSHKDRDTIVGSLKSGAHDFISKPVMWDGLKPRLLKLFPTEESSNPLSCQ
jgi:two-component system, chemotaxis family, chemotaxis protein CheY